jgi:mRNA interferase MazF
MILAKGDIVLVPFPFTNLRETKLRPAVVLWVDSVGRDVTLCFISSQNIDSVAVDEFLIDELDPEFLGTGLKIRSKIRVSRIVTVERQLLRQ